MRDTRRARLILGLLLAVALVLITVDHRQRGDSLFDPVRAVGASLFGVAERAGTGVARPVGDFIDTFTSAPESKRRIEVLRAENARLRRELTAHSLDRERSAELTRMLGLSGLGGYRVVAAQVIARRGVPGFEDAVEIDAGTGDGVKPEMTVLNGDGLVGRVVHTAPASATVVLLTDPASSAGARVEGSNEIGLITGLGPVAEGRLVRFRLLDAAAPLTAGRRIVSFGSQHGMPYAPGVPLGTIQRVEATPGELTRVAYARPFVDFNALDVVGVVVQAPQRDPRDAMLPKPPAAAARADSVTPPHRTSPPASPSPVPSSTARGAREGGRGQPGATRARPVRVQRPQARSRPNGAHGRPSGVRHPASGRRPSSARARPGGAVARPDGAAARPGGGGRARSTKDHAARDGDQHRPAGRRDHPTKIREHTARASGGGERGHRRSRSDELERSHAAAPGGSVERLRGVAFGALRSGVSKGSRAAAPGGAGAGGPERFRGVVVGVFRRGVPGWLGGDGSGGSGAGAAPGCGGRGDRVGSCSWGGGVELSRGSGAGRVVGVVRGAWRGGREDMKA
ncbi:rod shape-determining protein MreC [Sphaerisporangium corydalis]|uniref:rod shape-determining protein MreC n=1 Tax=Sphaerisporangium corydalis TaxID=1441875 RepID=UPI0021D26C5D|nr:rod shape-determining protein MreC [Sphaerisporangium corydalis]